MDQETKLRVVCIGDSITEGFGLGEDPSVYYPSRLQEFLGENYAVFNEGVTCSCVTMMEDDTGRTFGLPYVLQPEYDEALSLAGDIYPICLEHNFVNVGHGNLKRNDLCLQAQLRHFALNIFGSPQFLRAAAHADIGGVLKNLHDLFCIHKNASICFSVSYMVAHFSTVCKQRNLFLFSEETA